MLGPRGGWTVIRWYLLSRKLGSNSWFENSGSPSGWLVILAQSGEREAFVDLSRPTALVGFVPWRYMFSRDGCPNTMSRR